MRLPSKPKKGSRVGFTLADAPSCDGPKVVGLHFWLPARRGGYELDFRGAKARPLALSFASQLYAQLAGDGNRRGGMFVRWSCETIWKFIEFLEADNGVRTETDITADHFIAYRDHCSKELSVSTARRGMALLVATLNRIDDDKNSLCEDLRSALRRHVVPNVPRLKPRDSFDDAVLAQLRQEARKDAEEIAARFTLPLEWPEEVAHYAKAVERRIEEDGAIGISCSREYHRLRSNCQRIGMPVSGLWRNIYRRYYLDPDDIVPLLILIGLDTGIEDESIRFLSANCLGGSRSGKADLTYTKARAKFDKRILSVLDKGSYSTGGIIRNIVKWTSRARREVGGSKLFTYYAQGKIYDGIDRISYNAVRWGHSKNIRGADGELVTLHLSRLRKSVKREAYVREKGNVWTFSRDHSLPVRILHYAEIEHNKPLHELALVEALEDIESMGRKPVEYERTDSLPATAQETWAATCENPTSSPFAEHGDLCPQPKWGCLDCKNAVYSAAKLPALLTFLDELVELREQSVASDWERHYGRAYRRIAHQILRGFQPSEIEAAAAEKTPLPSLLGRLG